jgi:DNA-binding transcriptional regulator YiaG
MMDTRRPSKYDGLYRYLVGSVADRLQLDFDEIERIIQGRLPRSARRGVAFWSNRKRGAVQAAAWMAAGFRVTSVDLASGMITFERPRFQYSLMKEGDSYRWGSESVRALRGHLGVSQADMARLLGVRQQTVSEWESGVYEPTRARSNHLTLVAERAEFPFGEGSDEDRQTS